jgi:acetyltransferase
MMKEKEIPPTASDPSPTERSHDILRRRRPVLDAMFAPKSVALIGATDRAGSVGRTILENLRAHDFGGAIFPVNPHRAEVLGLRAFSRIADVPAPVDLALIVTPAATVPAVVAECAAAGVQGAVIVSAGFRERGESGRALEAQVLANARAGRMRIIGPNCLGVMLPHAGLNATFAAGMARPGNVAFISQSGALCTAILDWSFRENVGFSAFVSVGSMLDVGWGDLIFHLGDDPRTKSIVIYMESVGDPSAGSGQSARSFLSAAREVALTKPIVAIKVGRTAQAARAAASHTGALTGSAEVLDAALHRAGVLRVETIEELFDMAEVLAKQPRPRGPRLAIVTNAGGPAALATDHLVLAGGEVAALSSESLAALDRLLPDHWSHGNPVDLLGDADAQRYASAVEIVARDPQNDGVLAILTPQAMTECVATAERIGPFAAAAKKPLLASWMGGREVAAGESALNAAGFPTYAFPDSAARAFAAMWRYSHGLDALYETPALLAHSQPHSHAGAAKIIAAATGTLLTELESKKLLAAYGIPAVETHFAETESMAVKIAARLGGEVVLKLHSETIAHKSEVGGVKLNLRGAAAVRRAWREIAKAVRAEDFCGVTVQPMIARGGIELILGSALDPQFGPVLLFGAGGTLVEVMKDRALGLPPLNATLARRLIEQTRISAALKGARGQPPVDLAALEDVLMSFSQLVAEQRAIREIDINPLLASGTEIIALDARVILHEPGTHAESLPPLAIRPYPAQYVTAWKLRDGSPVTIRPIRPEDEPLMIAFHRTLSEESVHFRYFGQLTLDQRTAHERLRRICFNDYAREIALVAVRRRRDSSEILGVGRLSRAHGSDEAEFALLIGDRWQGHGLGTRLLELLVQIGREEGLARIIGHILPENGAMQRVARKAGFTLRFDAAAVEWEAEIDPAKAER